MNLRIFIALRDKFYAFVLSGDDYARFKGVKVGTNSRILTKLFGSEPWLVSIGNNCVVTRGVFFLTHDASTSLIIDEKGRRYFYRRIVIGNNVMIGVNSIIMPGVRIEDDVIVAAGSVVTKSVPSGSVIAGNPAKIIKKFEDYRDYVLDKYYSHSDLDLSLSYKERVLKILTCDFKDYLKE